MDQRDRRNYLLIGGLLIVLGGLFLLRGPVRAVSGGSDLIHLYVAAALYIEAGDPYDGTQCVEQARQAGYDRPEHVADGSLYPLPTLAAFAPLALLSWDVARLVWLIINLVACGILVWSAAQWLRVKDPGLRWMAAVLLVVAWGPVATSLSLGQLSLVVTASLCAGLVLLQRDRMISAGVLIGLASVIKPQLGLGFFLAILLMQHWRASAAAGGVIAAFALLSFGRIYAVHGTDFGYLPTSIGDGLASGGIMDAGINGPLRHQMIDLNPLVHLFASPASVGLIAMAIVGLLTTAALVRLFRLGLREHLLLSSAGVGLLILMPIYHRYYDAVLLLPLLIVVINGLLANRRDITLWVVGLAVAPLLFPVPALFARLMQRGTVPESLADNPVWKYLIMQHQSWCLLIAAVALVLWVWRLPVPAERPAEAEPKADTGSAV